MDKLSPHKADIANMLDSYLHFEQTLRVFNIHLEPCFRPPGEYWKSDIHACLLSTNSWGKHLALELLKFTNMFISELLTVSVGCLVLVACSGFIRGPLV